MGKAPMISFRTNSEYEGGNMNTTAMDRFQAWLCATRFRQVILAVTVIGFVAWLMVEFLTGGGN